MCHAAEKIVPGNVVTGYLRRIASAVTCGALRVCAVVTIRGSAVGHVVDVRIGGDHGDRSDLLGVRISAQQEVGGQIALHREALEVGRTQRAAAALAHLLIVIEHINHRADIFDWAEDRVGVTVGID
jgi:hypothetical protein